MKRISAITVRNPAPWAERSAPLCRNRSDGEELRHRGCVDCQTSLLTAVFSCSRNAWICHLFAAFELFAVTLFLRTHAFARGNSTSHTCFSGSKNSGPICFSEEPSGAVIQATRACACLLPYRTSILSPTLNSPRQPPNFTPWLLTSRVWARWLFSLPETQSRTGTTDMVLFDRRLPVRNRGMFYAYSEYRSSISSSSSLPLASSSSSSFWL